MNIMKRKALWSLVLVLIGPLYLAKAHAVCAFANGAKTGSVTFALPTLAQPFNPSDSTPQKLATVTMTSAELASAMGIGSTVAVWGGCTGNLIWNPLRTTVAGTSPNSTGYISTGIDNLYFYLYAGAATTGNFSPFSTPTTSGAAWSRALNTIHGSVPPWSIMGNVALVLYQTGPVRQGGTIAAGPVAELKLSDGLQVMTMSTSALTVNVLACTLTTPVVAVNLPTVYSRDFTGIGNTSEEASFRIGTNCDSGVMPTMTFSGATSTAGDTVFGINSGGNTATGLGVQLLYSGSVVKQNEAVSLGTVSTAGATDFPFTARYIQTDQQVTSGDVNTTITFTLAYK